MLKKEVLKRNADLDKYYTKLDVAKKCYKLYLNKLSKVGIKDNITWLEPSAGSGAFLHCLNEDYLGFDIEPTSKKFSIKKADFLNDNISKHFEKLDNHNVFVIGNPPFGKKSKLAIEFINKSFEYSENVGFILPIQFKKWSAQSKINKNAKLVLDVDLEEKAFEFMGKDYGVRCCFQIWSIDKRFENFGDLRITKKPPTEHKDFILYQFNRTEEAKKYFDLDWDFAVPRQGYMDFTFKAYKKEDCNLKHQWMLVKAKNKTVLKKLEKIDFDGLSKKNIGTPGFGKADLIQEYCLKYGGGWFKWLKN